MRLETRILDSFPAAARHDAEPPNGLRRARRACEGAERGERAPASDRAGVWGGAPR